MFDIEKLFNNTFIDDKFTNKAVTIKIIDGNVVFSGMGLTDNMGASLIEKYCTLFKLLIEEKDFKVMSNKHISEYNQILQKNYFEINYSLIIPLSQRITRPSMKTLLGLNNE